MFQEAQSADYGIRSACIGLKDLKIQYDSGKQYRYDRSAEDRNESTALTAEYIGPRMDRQRHGNDNGCRRQQRTATATVADVETTTESRDGFERIDGRPSESNGQLWRNRPQANKEDGFQSIFWEGILH